MSVLCPVLSLCLTPASPQPPLYLAVGPAGGSAQGQRSFGQWGLLKRHPVPSWGARAALAPDAEHLRGHSSVINLSVNR